jgi:hypothetical protein
MGRREVDAFLNELSTHSKASCGRLYEEQPQLRDLIGFSNEKNTADSFTISLRYPAALA